MYDFLSASWEAPKPFLLNAVEDFISKTELLPQARKKIKHRPNNGTIYYHNHQRTQQKMVTICVDVVRFSFTYKKGRYFSTLEKHPDIVFLASVLGRTPRVLIGTIKEHAPHSWQ